MISERHTRIEKRAYGIWESAGRPHGAHDTHWLQAVAEIELEDAAKPAHRKGAAKPKAAAATVSAGAAVSAKPKVARKA